MLFSLGRGVFPVDTYVRRVLNRIGVLPSPLTEATGFEDRRRALLAQLAEKETEGERVLTLFRRGTISDDEAEREQNAVAKEAGQVREMIESLRAQSALVEAQEAFLTDSAALLDRLHNELSR